MLRRLSQHFSLSQHFTRGDGSGSSSKAFLPQGSSERLRLTSATVGFLLAGVWAVSSAVATGLNWQPLKLLELEVQALFFRLRGPLAPPNNLVILAIDEDSLHKWSNADEKALEAIQSWPWRRTAYAEAIDKLMQAGARSVSLDLVFDQPSDGDRAQDDQALKQALKRYTGRIVLAATHNTSQTDENGLEQLVYPDPMFLEHSPSVGLINFLPEVNRQYRRFPSIVYPSQIDSELLKSQPDLSFFAEATLKAANQPFPKPKGDDLFFYGGQNTFRTIPFWYVLHPKNWEVLQTQQVFKNKIVLIGRTDSASNDSHPTPFGMVPGVEIHANAIATLMQNQAIAEALPNPTWRGLLLLLGVGSIGIALGKVSQRPVWQMLWAVGGAMVWAGVGYGCFTYAGLIVPVALPVAAIALTGLSYLGTGAIAEHTERTRLRRTLERYVAPAIVQEILNQPEDFHALLQGRKINAAVLFCDIRGFTTLSFRMPADELVAQLNVYLDAMVRAIIGSGGTIDKFIGDAVMAEFGSPVSRGEKADAMNAIRAALAMRIALAALHQQWQQEGKTPFFNGIGISYGEMIAGNIGSEQRLEYTAIGDTVNVASRVESLTKSFCTDILITETLYAIVQEEVEVTYVGDHALRGREASPMRLYSLIGLKGEDHTLYKQVHHQLRQHLNAKSQPLAPSNQASANSKKPNTQSDAG